MADFEQSQQIDAAPDAVWRLVSDPRRLADWVPTTSASRPEGEDHVHLRGESHGHDYDTSGGFVTDDAAPPPSWDSPRPSRHPGTPLVAANNGGPRATPPVPPPPAPPH